MNPGHFTELLDTMAEYLVARKETRRERTQAMIAIQNEKLKLQKQQMKLDNENKRRQIEYVNDNKNKQIKFDHANKKRQIEIDNENKQRQIEIDRALVKSQAALMQLCTELVGKKGTDGENESPTDV